MKALTILLNIVLITLSIISCTNSRVVSYNLSKDAEQFKINRRIVFYNGITDNYMLTITGLCAIKKDRKDNQLEVTCKTGPDAYKKHFLGISDNVTYFVEQLEYSKVDIYHYKVIFKPQLIIPNIELSTEY